MESSIFIDSCFSISSPPFVARIPNASFPSSSPFPSSTSASASAIVMPGTFPGALSLLFPTSLPVLPMAVPNCNRFINVRHVSDHVAGEFL